MATPDEVWRTMSSIFMSDATRFYQHGRTFVALIFLLMTISTFALVVVVVVVVYLFFCLKVHAKFQIYYVCLTGGAE